VLAGEVVAPVVLEVAVGDDCPQGEDGLGAVQAPSRASQIEAVGYEMAAGALDDTRRDRPAGFEGLAVAQELALVSQVADAGVGPAAPAAFQPGGTGFGGDGGGGPVAVAAQYGEGLDCDPVLGGGIPGIVEAPCSAPYVLQLSTVSGRESYVLAGHIVVAIDVTLTRR
jgi:hypothetical protein